MELKIHGIVCCSAFCMESEFHIMWHGDFKSWFDLQNDEEIKKLKDIAQKKLTRTGGKGKGKAKTGNASQSNFPAWRKF